MKLIVSILLITMLQACSLGGGPVPQDHFYRLPEINLKQLPLTYNEIVIKPVKATGLYHERAIIYIDAQQPLELKRYHYSFWSSTPAKLVHNALYQGVKSTELASRISWDVSDVRPDLILDTRIIHFERLIEDKKVSLVVALEITVKNGKSAGSRWSKRYQVIKTVQNANMHLSVEAFGEALNEITRQLTDDLLAKSKQ